MSYEYKELIEQAIIDDDRPLDWEEGFKELDEVYAKAAKANEYEAKAKAFDESLKGFKELERLHEEVRKVSKRNQDKAEVYKEVLFHVIREMESNLGESGEYDAKK